MEEAEFNLRPKDVFTNVLLIPTLRVVKDIIFSSSVHTDARLAIRPMRGLISSLSDEAKTALAPQMQRLTELETNCRGCKREEIESIYNQIASYLHQTYIKAFDSGISDRYFKELEDRKDEQE